MEIIVDNLTKKFKKVTVLDNINMKFESGKIYGIVGRNGSGKSVFLKILCSFYKPTTGNVYFDNKKLVIELLQLYYHFHL